MWHLGVWAVQLCYFMTYLRGIERHHAHLRVAWRRQLALAREVIAWTEAIYVYMYMYVYTYILI